MNRDILYLASQSPRRLEILKQMGIQAELLLPETDEDAEGLEQTIRGESALRYVQRVTQLKLDAAIRRHERRKSAPGLVLCADTTVSMGSRIFGKPNSSAEAVEMLAQLSGKTHRVLTAIAAQFGTQRAAALSVSHVEFLPMDVQEIERYVATGEPIGKAGAYAMQGLAARYVVKIRGSHSGIVGLPIFETAQLLRQLAWNS